MRNDGYIDISEKHAQVAILSVNNQSDLINVKGLFAQETEQEIIKLTLHDHDTKIQYLLYEGEDLMKTYLSKFSLVNNKIHSCKLMIRNVADQLQQLMLDSLRAMSYINESLEIKHRLELSLDKLIQDKGQMQNSYACEMSKQRGKINEIIGYSALTKLYHASSDILNAKYKKSGVAALTEVISAITQQLQEVKSRIPLFAEYSKGSNRLFGKRYFLWLKSECEFFEKRLAIYTSKPKDVHIEDKILGNITESNKAFKWESGEAMLDRSIGGFALKVKKEIFNATLNSTDRDRENEYDRQMYDSIEEFDACYESYKKACLLEIEQQGAALKEKIKSGFAENRKPWLSGENAESRHLLCTSFNTLMQSSSRNNTPVSYFDYSREEVATEAISINIDHIKVRGIEGDETKEYSKNNLKFKQIKK